MEGETIGIIGGTGKMGEFFARFFQRHGYRVLVSGRYTELTNIDLVKASDLILFSVPIDETVPIIQEVAPFLTPHQSIGDFTSLKKEPLNAMLATKAGEVFGMHPMFGPPLSGSVRGQNIVFCSGRGEKWKTRFISLFEHDGASILNMNPEEHDNIMTIIQGLSHFLDITFAKTIERMGIDLGMVFRASSPAYHIKMALMGRTLAQSAHLYGNIQIANPQNPETLRMFFTAAEELQKIITEKNLPAFQEYFQKGAAYFGEFATLSQKESDAVIDFLARRKTLPTPSNLPSEESVGGVGILGPENTFSHIAFEKFLRPQGKSPQFFPSLPALFSALKKGKIQEAFVPVENMLHGSVPEAIDGIASSNIPMAALFEMRISPSLFVAKGTKREEIDTIISHPQPLAQCSQFLESEFPDATIIAVNSTGEAMERAISEPRTAAIAAPEMAGVFDGEELAKNIANTEQNATRFAFLSATEKCNGDEYEGAMVFSFAKDSPGSLESVLHDFSSRSINLTKIESRPLGTAFGEYLFFVQFFGKLSLALQEDLLKSISAKTTMCTFLGNFPVLREE